MIYTQEITTVLWGTTSCAAVYASDSAIFYYKPSSLRVIEWLISSFKSPKHHSKIILINSFLDSGDEKTFCSAGSLRQETSKRVLQK